MANGFDGSKDLAAKAHTLGDPQWYFLTTEVTEILEFSSEISVSSVVKIRGNEIPQSLLLRPERFLAFPSAET